MPGSRNNGHDDGRSPIAIAMQWVSQLTTISFEMALPALLGYFADRRWGTEPWGVVAGAVIGFIVAMMHLVQLANRAGGQQPPRQENTEH